MTDMFDPVEDAIAAFKNGEFVIVMDDESRENEGDLIMSAALVTPQKMAFMIRHTSGLICVPMLGHDLDKLELPLMVPENTDRMRTAYTISCDAADGTTTGISASDRALTANKLASSSDPLDFTRPGHMFPLRYHEGGVLRRTGHTEAAVDLCRLAGLAPVGIISEIVKDDGEMARRDDCGRLKREWGMKMVTIEALAAYIREKHGEEW
ncbi:3,4-dihydroxy-2-butanone 4-phosphate synthase [Saitoella complicata NRRL Y-17804]|nr:3,4-dihydroxy-2-butanone 4-phosphate synthase [Saitoella complicata NRRL Y-17804]ODQ51513.1 3,4-dihydroxy-2-butanone 4-phosphate synthase [Saitoella complicata NRRL Y-17804]